MFQLTTSRRGRRISGDNFINLCFNSRPHEEVDLSLSIAKDFLDVSTHDLTKRSTLQRFHRFFSGGYFNSRPHEEVDLWHRALGNQCNCFNSRPHEEVDDGWICDNSVFILVSTHDLTKRSTLFFVRKMAICHCFNSRPHEEVDSFYLPSPRQGSCFNSRPHEEVDFYPLNWSANVLSVSTHDLTKRSTSTVSRKIENHLFQLTTSRRGRLTTWIHSWHLDCFNSRPHEEVDRAKSSDPRQS